MDQNISALEELLSRVQTRLFHIAIFDPVYERYFPSDQSAPRPYDSRKTLLADLSSASSSFLQTVESRISDPPQPSEVQNFGKEICDYFDQRWGHLIAYFGMQINRPGGEYVPTFIGYSSGTEEEVDFMDGEFHVQIIQYSAQLGFDHADMAVAFAAAFPSALEMLTHTVRRSFINEQHQYSVRRVDADTKFLQMGYYVQPAANGSLSVPIHEIVSNSPHCVARLLAFYYDSQHVLDSMLHRARVMTQMPTDS